MTQVEMDGKVIETNLPPEAVQDLQQPEAQPEAQPEVKPEPTAKPAEPEAEVKPEPAKVEEQPEAKPTRKAKPIANLLAKNHELEAALEAERTAKAELEAKLAQLSGQQPSAQNDNDIKSLAEKYGVDEQILADIVATARKGMTAPELPQEVKELIKKQQDEARQEEELKRFDQDLNSLKRTFKDEAPLTDSKVREKLLELAYSTDKAPDGEPYFQKPLHELYFSFVKPEVEPGRPSAEPSRGGSNAGTKILDFQEILDRDDPKDIEAMDDATFDKYQTWLKDRQGLPPINRGRNS